MGLFSGGIFSSRETSLKCFDHLLVYVSVLCRHAQKGMSLESKHAIASEESLKILMTRSEVCFSFFFFCFDENGYGLNVRLYWKRNSSTYKYYVVEKRLGRLIEFKGWILI